MKFKVGDYVAHQTYNFKVCDYVTHQTYNANIYYYKILEINEEKKCYKFLILKTGAILTLGFYFLNDTHTRLMTDEEKVELL